MGKLLSCKWQYLSLQCYVCYASTPRGKVWNEMHRIRLHTFPEERLISPAQEGIYMSARTWRKRYVETIAVVV